MLHHFPQTQLSFHDITSHLFPLEIHESIDGLSDSHEDFVAESHLLGQYMEQGLLAVGQSWVREPA